MEKRIVLLEDIIKALNIDPNQVEESNKAESENLKKIEKLEKRINTLDKKIKHLENVNSEKKEKPDLPMIKCKKCSEVFSDKKKLKDHLSVKHTNVIKCRFCSEIFAETWMLEQHINIHVEKQFKCEECGQHFHLKWRLMKHTEGHKNTKTKFCNYFNNADKCPFQELGCMFKHEVSPQCKFKSFCNKQRCQFRHKSLLEEVISSSNPLEETDSKNDEIFQYSCTFCDKTFNQKGEIELHVESEHSNSSIIKQGFSCGKCLFIFDSEEKFQTHLTGTEHNLVKVDDYSEDSEDEEYSDNCRLCGKVFTTYETFDNHQNTHLQYEKCKVCF